MWAARQMRAKLGEDFGCPTGCIWPFLFAFVALGAYRRIRCPAPPELSGPYVEPAVCAALCLLLLACWLLRTAEAVRVDQTHLWWLVWTARRDISSMLWAVVIGFCTAWAGMSVGAGLSTLLRAPSCFLKEAKLYSLSAICQAAAALLLAPAVLSQAAFSVARVHPRTLLARAFPVSLFVAGIAAAMATPMVVLIGLRPPPIWLWVCCSIFAIGLCLASWVRRLLTDEAFFVCVAASVAWTWAWQPLSQPQSGSATWAVLCAAYGAFAVATATAVAVTVHILLWAHAPRPHQRLFGRLLAKWAYRAAQSKSTP